MTAWLDALRDRIGEREIPGDRHNPVIVNWGKIAGIDWWNNDEDAWCAVAVNGVLVEAGYPSTKSALARSFIKYGTRLSRPVRGAIVVFPRGSKSWQGHVGIVEEVHSNGTITVIDGNVSNMVKRSTYRINTILPNGIRWPPGAPLPPEARSGAMPMDVDFELGDRLIRQGDRGADIEELQEGLAVLGYMSNDPDIATFGGQTDLAVRKFQSDAGLSIDGIVGPATAAALNERLEDRRVREKARKMARESGGQVGAITGAGGIVSTVGVGTAISTAERVQSLNDGTPFGLIIAAVVGLGIVGGLAYWFVQRRAADKAGVDA